ncbi:hypothetical protein CLOM_g379 [Closterium sp. NIES-68]|nr:hypothetical protein CLOM_g379 [Closterium sp. NIES-68]GJP78505.1 hypothetical protein CLOP_g8796 [Closterium sp. NIES-67]
MPSGSTNAPSTFQLTMNEIFRPLLDMLIIVYLEDILVYSTTREQHLKDLEAVFYVLQQNRLITKGSKCKFLKHELEFLGNVISVDGVKIDPKKIATIKEKKPPAYLRELQSILGFVHVQLWTKTWQQYGTRLHLSTAYHPQSDGQIERTNQTMEQLIRTTRTDPTHWVGTLPLIEFAYNNAPSATTTQSPFFLNYGIDLTIPLSPPIKNPATRSQQFVENL